MTVKDLIEKLQKFPENAKILVYEDWTGETYPSQNIIYNKEKNEVLIN